MASNKQEELEKLRKRHVRSLNIRRHIVHLNQLTKQISQLNINDVRHEKVAPEDHSRLKRAVDNAYYALQKLAYGVRKLTIDIEK